MRSEDINSIKFLKLRTGEDIVAYVSETDTHYMLVKPMVFMVEVDMDDGKQYVHSREWLPQVLVMNDHVEIEKSEFILITDIEKAFKDDFIKISKYLYSIKPVSPSSEDGEMTNVISLRGGHNQKKDPSIH